MVSILKTLVSNPCFVHIEMIPSDYLGYKNFITNRGISIPDVRLQLHACVLYNHITNNMNSSSAMKCSTFNYF